MAATTAELQAEVRQLLLEVEELLVTAGGAFPAGQLLRQLQEVAERLSAYRLDAVPPDELALRVAIEQVRARLAQERAYLAWRRTLPVQKLLAYNLVWVGFIALAAALYVLALPRRLPREAEVVLGCMAWGALGACFCSIIALVRRAADRTLDPAYGPWHVMKPVVGAFTGALVYLILAGGIKFFATDDLVPAGTGLLDGLLAAVAPRATLAYLLAVLSGYHEKAFLTKLETLIKTLLGVQPPEQQPPCTCCCCCKGGGCKGCDEIPAPPPD